jgi:hypothetical protein
MALEVIGTRTPDRLTQLEISILVNDYIEVHKGYLGDFSYSTHANFYPQYCDLDINPYEYEGTTRERFIEILSTANGITQAKIVVGILSKYPVSYFPEDVRKHKQELYDRFSEVVTRLEAHYQSAGGVRGEIKNLIFAANGPKPELVLTDATTNTIRIVKNEEYCLVYSRELSEHGLLWGELVDWWRDLNNLRDWPRSKQRKNLFARLKLSMGNNEAEKLLFTTYYKEFFEVLDDNLPALIPQVYLHYDPYTVERLGGVSRLLRQRMDFLLLFPNRRHVVLEVDGKQHYAEGDTASPQRYAEMVEEDRNLKLAGYEVFRFGGYEFRDQERVKRVLKDFLHDLLSLHSIL